MFGLSKNQQQFVIDFYQACVITTIIVIATMTGVEVACGYSPDIDNRQLDMQAWEQFINNEDRHCAPHALDERQISLGELVSQASDLWSGTESPIAYEIKAGDHHNIMYEFGLSLSGDLIISSEFRPPDAGYGYAGDHHRHLSTLNRPTSQ